jgi:hypothetical protein
MFPFVASAIVVEFVMVIKVIIIIPGRFLELAPIPRELVFMDWARMMMMSFITI